MENNASSGNASGNKGKDVCRRVRAGIPDLIDSNVAERRPPGLDKTWPTSDNRKRSDFNPQDTMNSENWYPAYKWSDSLRCYEMMAIFRFEQHAREWERGEAFYVGIPGNTPDAELKDSKWARRLLGYRGKSSSSFWQFVHSNGVPHIRVNSRRIKFSERAVHDWLLKRSAGGSRNRF